MYIEIANEYPALPAAVYDAFGDPDFLVRRSEDVGHVPVEVLACEPVQEGMRVVLRRRVPLTVPRFARKVLTPHAVVTQAERWQVDAAGYHGTFEARAVGIPGHVEGSMELRASDGGCVHLIHGRVLVDLPVIGGKIAGLLAADTGKVLALEHDFGVSYFAATG